MNQPVFYKKEHQEFYNKNGYIYIPGFLNYTELHILCTLFNKKEKSFFDKGFHRTLDMSNLQRKKEICGEISRIVTPIAQQILKDYRFLLNSFMSKEKNAEAFDIHQNWTFVEEDKFTSLAIWIPLQDVNEQNGCLYFVPGSNRWNKYIRGNGTEWKYENKTHALMKEMVALPMNAGDAVIFDDATIHYTSANKTRKPRISIAQVMIPENAEPVFFNYNIKTDRIEKYIVKPDFYLNFTNKYMKGDFSEVVQISQC